jgi:PAS domain S-box-containing protein
MHTTILDNQRKQAERAAEASEQRYRRLLASVTDYVYSVGISQGGPAATTHGPGCEAVTGYTSREFEADPFLWYRMIYSEDKPAVTAQAEAILRGETPPPLEHRIVHKDGRIRWIKNVTVPRKDDQGRLISYDGLISDITDRKRAELALRQSEERLALVIQGSSDGVWDWDLRTNAVYFSARWKAMLGYTEPEVEHHFSAWERLLHPADRERALASIQAYLSGQTPTYELEHQLRHKDGSYRWILSRGVALRDAQGKAVRMAGSHVDLTERKRAELALRQSHQTQEVLNALLSISLRDISLDETLQQVIDQILAVPWLSLEAKGAIFVVEADPLALVLKAQRNLPAGCQAACGLVPFGRCHCGRAAASGKTEFTEHVDGHHEIRYEGMTPHGHYCVPIIVTAGQVLGVINLYLKENHRREPKEDEFLNAVANVVGGIIQRKRAEEQLKQALADLTTAHEELKATHEELKGTELQLIQAAKLESVGILAAGVAHEVKNPLQTILMGLDYLANNLPGGDNNTTMVLSEMRDAVTRANTIVRELLQLSAAKDFEPKAEDLNCVVERSLWLMNNEIMALQINVVRELGTDLPRVRLDRSKMEQVFLNLFHNALHAMSPGGVLTVTTRQCRFGEDLKLGRPAFARFKPSELVVIAEVQDTGKGIPEENLPKIFDPFFTTKPAGVGTGLGLSVVKRIMDLHGGAVDIRNAPRGGVVVTLMLRTEPERTL